MSALSKLVRIKDSDRNALQNAVIAYDHRPQEAAEILADMQARIEKLEEVARVAGFIELNRHNFFFNGRHEADPAALHYMNLLKEKLDALKGDK